MFSFWTNLKYVSYEILWYSKIGYLYFKIFLFSLVIHCLSICNDKNNLYYILHLHKRGSMAFLKFPWSEAIRLLGLVLILYTSIPCLISISFFFNAKNLCVKNINIWAGYTFTLEVVLLTAWYGISFKVYVSSFKIWEYLFFEGIVCIPITILFLGLKFLLLLACL